MPVASNAPSILAITLIEAGRSLDVGLWVGAALRTVLAMGARRTLGFPLAPRLCGRHAADLPRSRRDLAAQRGPASSHIRASR